MTAFVCPSKSTGSTTMLTRRASPRLVETLTKSGATSVMTMRFLSSAHWPRSPWPGSMVSRDARAPALSVARQQRQRGLTVAGGEMVDRALMGVHQRRQLGQEHLADGPQLTLTLKHASELGDVGLEPVLLAIPLRGFPQVRYHRVDVVFQLGDFAARFDLNRTCKIALGHRGSDLGDRTNLVGEIGGEQVDVTREIFPGSADARAPRPGRRACLRFRPRERHG